MAVKSNPFGPGKSNNIEDKPGGYTFTSRLKGAGKGALTGLVTTGSPWGALAGGGAGFVAPGLTGEQPTGGEAGGGGADGGGNSMSDVRARIEELRRQQYAQRTQNLQDVMGFFGPVNQELKNIYGVDMPTWSPKNMGGGGIPPQLAPYNGAKLKPQWEPFINPLSNTPSGSAAAPMPSPFSKPATKAGFVSRLRNPKSLPPGVQDPTQDVPGTGQPWKRRY